MVFLLDIPATAPWEGALRICLPPQRRSIWEPWQHILECYTVNLCQVQMHLLPASCDCCSLDSLPILHLQGSWS